MARPTYNPVVYFVEDAAARQLCDFIYVTGQRCQRDAKYMIGQSIHLCGIHTPGIGRCFRNRKPVVIPAPPEQKG